MFHCFDLLFFRSALQEVLIYTLENAEQYQTLHLLYTLAFRMSPPENLVLTNSNADHKKEKQDFLVPLMCENFVFAHGDDGGVIIRCQNDNADEHGNVDDILRDLQGADLSNSEVRALCIVELLDGLKKDDVGGDFFIYLMQELTNIISDFSDDMNNTNSGGTVSATLMLIFFHMHFMSDVLISVVSKFGKRNNILTSLSMAITAEGLHGKKPLVTLPIDCEILLANCFYLCFLPGKKGQSEIRSRVRAFLHTPLQLILVS